MKPAKSEYGSSGLSAPMMRTETTRPYTAMIPAMTTGMSDYEGERERGGRGRGRQRGGGGVEGASAADLHDELGAEGSHSSDSDAGLGGAICCADG